jgi:hypothetical protein
MTVENDRVIITVRRQWNDWQMADYRLDDVEDLHWTQVSGGVQAVAPRPFIHGYVWCDRMLAGELVHSCRHGERPHRIKVCITKTGNEKVWKEVLERAGPRSA